MKKVYILLLAALLAVVGFVLIRPLLISNEAIVPKAPHGTAFELIDSENKIKMLFPDSVTENSEETVISGVPCKIRNIVCSDGENRQTGIMIITIPSGSADSVIRNVVRNYFPGIDNTQNFKAGKLDGLKYQTYTCGVPVTNFIGISGNKIYHYTETTHGDSLNEDSSHLRNLMIDAEGRNLKVLLSETGEPVAADNNQRNPIHTGTQTEILRDSELKSGGSDEIRVDIPLKVYQANPDTVFYFVKQRYYAIEHTFQKSIACNFENGTSREQIIYPDISYTINLYENSKGVKPYLVLNRSYTGNAARL